LPVIASYFVGWSDGVGELEACLFGYGQYSRVLHTNGHFVFRAADGYREAWLSEGEVSALLRRIEDTGFFQVQGDGSKRELDSIYAVPDGYLPPDGLAYEDMTILEKTVSIYGGLFDYLVPQVRSAWDAFITFAPSSSAPYAPRAVQLWLYEIRGEVTPDDYRLTPIPPIMEWPDDLPSLSDFLAGDGIANPILDNGALPALARLFPVLPSSRLVTQRGRTYLIAACPVLP
jgi:hypothetical protein